MLALIAGAIVWLVRFALHKVFVIDVMEPLWSGGTSLFDQAWGQNLFLVNGEPAVAAPQLANYCDIDLACAPDDATARSTWFESQYNRLSQSPLRQSLLVWHFEDRLHDDAFMAEKVWLLDRVMSTLNRTIVVVSAVPPGRFTAAPNVATAGVPATINPQDWTPRWTRIMSQFTVIPVTPVPCAPIPEPNARMTPWVGSGWREMLWRLNALGFARSARFIDEERRDAVVERYWKEVLPYAWHPDRPALTINQLLIEVGERSESHYREIWDTCTPAEKLVLGQIAAEGLVNEKTQRTVRSLMARGLVRRQPNFVLMSETFRQFVLSTASRAEVSALEGQATSTWDTIRLPFMILLFGSLTFFFATQHELFNSALGIVTGLAASVPALVKVASLFGDRHDAQG